MKKKIIDEEQTKKKNRINGIMEFLLYLISYAIVIVFVSLVFPGTIRVDYSMYGLWAIIVVLVLTVLNKLLRPILVALTMPITLVTLGLFSLFINVMLLQITDILLGKHFEVNGIFGPLIVALIISFLNNIIDRKVIKPLLEKRR